MTNDNQLALVPHTYQGSLITQREEDGFINATAMCKAAGKEWSHFNSNASTKAFLEALEGSLGIPGDQIVQSIATGPNEGRGTWVHPQVAVNLAQWLSAEFAVKVSQWVVEWMSGRHPSERVLERIDRWDAWSEMVTSQGTRALTEHFMKLAFCDRFTAA